MKPCSLHTIPVRRCIPFADSCYHAREQHHGSVSTATTRDFPSMHSLPLLHVQSWTIKKVLYSSMSIQIYMHTTDLTITTNGQLCTANVKHIAHTDTFYTCTVTYLLKLETLPKGASVAHFVKQVKQFYHLCLALGHHSLLHWLFQLQFVHQFLLQPLI